MNQGAVMILFDDEGKVLMEERDQNTPNYPGYWNLPSGGSKPGENPEQTARRELIEEANYEAPSLELLFTSPQIKPDGEETLRYVFLIGYDPAQKTKKGDEGKALEFKDPRDLPNMKVFRDHLEFISRAIDMRHGKNPEKRG